jgi:hypothetical protein
MSLDMDAVLSAVVFAIEQDRAPRSLGRELTEALENGARLLAPGDLLGTREVAEAIPIDRTTASRWKKAGYLPDTFDEVAGSPLWVRADIAAFAARHHAEADAAGRRRNLVPAEDG